MTQKDTDKRPLAQEDEKKSPWQGRNNETNEPGFLFEDPLKSGQSWEEGESGEEGGEGKAGGTAGEIHFKDPYSIASRDDLLSPEEIKRLLITHKEQHKGNVDKQKNLLKDRIALKEGKLLDNRQKQGRGYGTGLNSFKTHPIALKAQFSGIDKQVSNLPNNNEAITNDELRNELQNRLENRLENRPENKPTSTPRLLRS